MTRQPGREHVRYGSVHDDPLGRHADLALVQEGPERRGAHGLVDVGVVEYQHGGLAAEFQNDGLEVARRGLRDDPTDPRRTREVDAPDCAMGDQRFHDLGGVDRGVADNVDDALAEVGFAHHLAEEAVDLRTHLGRFQHDRVATGERHGNGPHAQDHRRVPRGYAEHDPDRLAHRQGRHAGLIRRDDLAGDLRCQSRGVPQHLGAEFDIQMRPSRRRADLLDHGRREFPTSRFEKGGGPQQAGTSRTWAASRPGRERPCGCQGGVGGIRDGRRCCPARERSGDRVAPLETAVIRGGPILVLHEERHIEHIDLPDRVFERRHPSRNRSAHPAHRPVNWAASSRCPSACFHTRPTQRG